MYRESAYPGPNALDSSSYTNPNGDPQAALKQQYADQTIVADISNSGSQNAAEGIQLVREASNSDSQKKYEANRFLAAFMADNIDDLDNLERLGYELAGSPGYELAGSPSMDANIPYIPGRNLEGVPNAREMKDVLKRKYLKNPGGQELPGFVKGA